LALRCAELKSKNDCAILADDFELLLGKLGHFTAIGDIGRRGGACWRSRLARRRQEGDVVDQKGDA
jgi:hypothetical protein